MKLKPQNLAPTITKEGFIPIYINKEDGKLYRLDSDKNPVCIEYSGGDSSSALPQDIYSLTIETAGTIVTMNAGFSFQYYNPTSLVFEEITSDTNVNTAVDTVVAETKYYFYYNEGVYYLGTDAPSYDYTKKGWYYDDSKCLSILKGLTTSTVQWLGGINHNSPINMITINNDESDVEILTGGYWRDGKPKYRKVIDCGTLPNATNKYISIGESDLEDSWIINGWANNPTTGQTVTIPRPSVDVDATIESNTNIRITTSANYTAFTESYVTIEYTKTTD
jgi:hypothetical protein